MEMRRWGRVCVCVQSVEYNQVSKGSRYRHVADGSLTLLGGKRDGADHTAAREVAEETLGLVQLCVGR
jgi:hypothetical protein